MNLRFESFVNSEEYQTVPSYEPPNIGLRALLIQKSIKPVSIAIIVSVGLRALLIQKSIKLRFLRLSLIQLFESFVNSEEYQTETAEKVAEVAV